MCVPLISKGRAVGVLNASKTDPIRPFNETDRDFLAVLAGQAANAMEHARQYGQLASQSQIDGLTGLNNFAGSSKDSEARTRELYRRLLSRMSKA